VEQDLVEVRDRESALEEERVKVRETSVAMERARELEREAEREHIKMLESQVEQETEKSRTVQMEKENLDAQFVQLNEQFDNMLGMYKDIQSQLETKEAELAQLRESLEEAMMKARESHQSTLPVNVSLPPSSRWNLFFSPMHHNARSTKSKRNICNARERLRGCWRRRNLKWRNKNRRYSN